jgi:hypothetical protein
MQTFSKVLNALGMIAGGVAMFFGIRFLLHHQYSLYSERTKHMIPTVVILLVGLWLFLVGLIGFMRSKNQA